MNNPYGYDGYSTGKERDKETGYGYFGARYMGHELLTMWLSVDPLADKYPSISPYAYCAWNPIRLVDPDGKEAVEEDGWWKNKKTNEIHRTLMLCERRLVPILQLIIITKTRNPMRPIHTATAHCIKLRNPFSLSFILLVFGMTLGCENKNCPDNQSSAEGTARIITLNGITISISLPHEYHHASKEMIKSMNFYKDDVSNPMRYPQYVSSHDPREHLSVTSMTVSEFQPNKKNDESTFDKHLMEQFPADKTSPAIQLIEKHVDSKGHPYAYVMYITRYSDSDTLWRNHPNTFINPVDADSVECSIYYYTIFDGVEYFIHHYSLDSFEEFSFSKKRAVLESIEFHTFGEKYPNFPIDGK